MMRYWNDELNTIKLRFRLRLGCHTKRKQRISELSAAQLWQAGILHGACPERDSSGALLL
jgi:hypothetical protein